MFSHAFSFKLKTLTAAASIFLGLAVQSALADAYFDQGLRYFNQRNYKAAVPYFETAKQNSSDDSSVFYYAALTYHYMGDYPRAKAAYAQVEERFPGSEAATLASAALRRIDPNYAYRQKQGQAQASANLPNALRTSDDTSSDLASLPNEAKVYFTRSHEDTGNNLEISAELNNRGVKMYFDTGAENTCFGKNHLQALGINLPTGTPTGMAMGVGAGGVQKTWDMKVDLKVGNIMRHNFPISVQENLPTLPLLGQTFFRDYQYTIDPGANSISFKKKAAGAIASGSSHQRDNNVVPFTKEGKEIIVQVDVNGKTCPMIFDTGAEGIAFGQDTLKRLGIEIPEDAEEGVSTGIAGQTKSQNFTVRSMKMGPIIRSDIQVSCVEDFSAKPLLGQTFYQGWQYTIDNEARVIRFVRR